MINWISLIHFAEAMAEVEERGFGLKFDILDSNFVNIAIVVLGLIYLGRGVLGGILGDRRAAIEKALAEAEERQQAAAQDLAKQQGLLAEAQAEAAQIKERAEVAAKAAAERIALQAEADIVRLEEAAEREINAERTRVMTQLRRQLVEQALAKVGAELPDRLNDQTQDRLIDRSIQLLGGR